MLIAFWGLLMAAIPYLWYWIMGGLVAVFIATVAIFSERSVTDIVKNQSVSSKEKGSSEVGKNESDTDQKSDIVSKPPCIPYPLITALIRVKKQCASYK